MSDEREGRAYLGLGPGDEPRRLHPRVIDAIVYPSSMPKTIQIACDEAGVTARDRADIQRFSSFLRAIGPCPHE